MLGDDGVLAGQLEGFTVRKQQQAMADKVAIALEEKQVLVSEAGTGTGKTFAYLIPALLSGQKVIVSTGTRNLQDQLFHRDLPLIKKALSSFSSTALLKGRANYLCPQRLSHAGGLVYDDELSQFLEEIRIWATTTDTGDTAEIAHIAENHEVWRFATSTTDNCLGQKCPQVEHCFVLKARKKAMEADIVVVNHHLFFADMSLREDGFGELLPGADAVIMDEAHLVPEIAGQFFGQNLTSRQLLDLVSDTRAAYQFEAGDVAGFSERLDRFEAQLKQTRRMLGESDQRGALLEVLKRVNIKESFDKLTEMFDAIEDGLKAVSERGQELLNCSRRCSDLKQTYLNLIREDDSSQDELKWFETRGRGFALHSTPLDIGVPFGTHMKKGEMAWIFTSATLAVGKEFTHFIERLGLQGCEQVLYDSPFNYPEQALIYHPKGMPEPAHPQFIDALLQAAIPVLQASRGRAFMLFTSYRALQKVAELLPDRIDFPVFVQGNAPRSRLLDQFRETDNAILLGTSSFWEGIDVRGEALSCVIIDKLPFATPDDPVLQARNARVRENGGNPFMDIQLPHAVIRLKQGAGRLIRDVNDRGVLMLCDRRIKSKPYGKLFLASLPDMTRSQEIEEIRAFFNKELDVTTL